MENLIKKNKHILVVSQYFYPENFRINDITTEWVKRGYKVTVITGIPNYPKGKFYKGYGFFKRKKEVINGVTIIRLNIIPRLNNSFFLVLNYFSFVFFGWLWAKFTRIEADYVFNYEVSPMTQAFPAIWYAKRRKLPCYLYVTDLWPENVVFALKLKSKITINLIQYLVDNIYKNVSKILISSKGFYEPILSRGIDKSKIFYWPQFPEDIYHYIQKPIKNILLPSDNVFNITFAGNIGFSQGLSVLIEASKLLKKKKILVRFNIIGEGRYKNTFINNITFYRTEEYFNFIDKQHPSLISKYLSESDAAFISLQNEKVFDLTLPSKLQTYLACGVPILASANGELKNIITDSKSGLCSNSGNSKGLVDNILKLRKMTTIELNLMRKNGINYSKKFFNKDILLLQLEKELFK